MIWYLLVAAPIVILAALGMYGDFRHAWRHPDCGGLPGSAPGHNHAGAW
jgi:hypothetical protein